MIPARHPAIKAATYGMAGALCAAIGLWTPLEALVVSSVAFAVDGLVTSLLVGGKILTASSRWISVAVPFLGLFVGRSVVALLGY